MIFLLVCGLTKPNQIQTNQTKPNLSNQQTKTTLNKSNWVKYELIYQIKIRYFSIIFVR